VRPLAIVIGLLLAGAALACSGRVPPPGATLSGSVWVDGNANGIRDKCDPPGADASPRLELRGADGQTFETKADKNGRFTFLDVAAGKYTLGVRQSPGFQWPVTAPRDTETFGTYGLQLLGYEKLDGLDFGVVGHEPLKIYPDGYGLFVILFNDHDLDGELGVDECALRGPEGMTASADGEESSSFVGQLAIYKFEDLREPPREVKPAYQDWDLNSFLVATRLDPSGCAEEVTPAAVPGSRLFQAAIGMRMAQGTASLSASVFLDSDEDGVRDEGEPDSYLPVSVTGRCEDGPRMAPSVFEIGVYRFTNIPTGRWWVRLDTLQPYAEFEIYPTTPEVVEIDVQEHSDIAVEFGVSYPDAAFIRVLVVSDDNLNGEPDPGEDPLRDAVICVNTGGDSVACGGASPEGSPALLGPFQPGSYTLWVSGFGGRSTPFPDVDLAVTVGEGEMISLTIAVAP